MNKLLITLLTFLVYACNPQIQTINNQTPIVTTVTPVQGELLFSSERGGDRDLYLIDADGTNCRVLLDLPSLEGHGDWSPDGSRIVFFSTMNGSRDLYLIDLNDKELTPIQLTFSKGDNHLPDWSPDGSRIVFESTRDGNSEIYLIDSDGTNERRLTTNNNSDKAPVWSRDGKTINYTTILSGGDNRLTQIKVTVINTQDSYPEEVLFSDEEIGYTDWSYDNKEIVYHANVNGAPEIFKMDANGSNRVQLTNEPRGLWVPVWSPDKNWIAYDSEGGFGTGDIYIMNANGEDIRQITFDSNSDWGPDWRPEPKPVDIMFDSDRDGDREIYLIDSYGNNLRKLTNNKVKDGLAFWSPDREKIVYFSDIDGDDEIFIMNKDGSNNIQLTFNAAIDRAATWSPKGDLIAFASTRNGSYDIYIMNADGSNQRQITADTVKNFWPAWSKNGDYITYTHFAPTQDTYKIKVPEKNDNAMPIPVLIAKNCSRCESSPNGEKIAFSSNLNGNWNIFVMKEDTTEKRQITFDTDKDNWVPTWSSDGKCLIFSKETGYTAALCLITINSLEVIQLTTGDSQDWRPLFE